MFEADIAYSEHADMKERIDSLEHELAAANKRIKTTTIIREFEVNRFKAELVRKYYWIVNEVNQLQQYLMFHPHDHHARDEVKALRHAEAAVWARVLEA